jgi:hypothetical protein
LFIAALISPGFGSGILNFSVIVVSVKFCKKGIGGMRLVEIKRFMGRVKGGGEASSLSWVSALS